MWALDLSIDINTGVNINITFPEFLEEKIVALEYRLTTSTVCLLVFCLQ